MNIEKLATSAVEESISKTEVLDPFVNDGDKEPSWDGNVYIYADKHKTKKGIKKVPVQVKGEVRKKLPLKKPPKYPVSLIDLENWLNDGGVLLFVVLLSENGDEKYIYYNALLPVKIRHLIKFSRGKKRKSISLTAFPDNNVQKVSVFLNFYSHMQKQTSYAQAPLFSLDELEKKGVLENVSFSVTTYGKRKSEYDIETAFLQNEVYMYATVKGSSIPQPLPDIPMDLHISREMQGNVMVGDRIFYQSYRVIRSLAGEEILLGKSIVFKLFPDKNKGTLTYKLKGTLSDFIRDTECLIAVLENKEISINGARFPFDGMENAEIERYRRNLSYYQDVKKMLDLLGVKKELECEGLTEQDENNLRNFTNAVVYGKNIWFTDCADTMLYGRFKVANLVLLIWADRNGDNGYRVQSYFNDHRIALFENSDTKMEHPYPITHYVLLKKNDFVEAANIDYQRIKEDRKQNDKSPLVTEQITLFMLEMLSAYDELEDKNADLLSTAEAYCDWLIENSGQPNDMMLLNRLQIIKRKRDFEQTEISQLQELRKESKELSVRCAANLLLGKQEVAQDCFDEMNEQEKDRFISFPICHFGNLVYERNEEA